MKVANYRTMDTSHESRRLLLLLWLHMRAADQLASRKRALGHRAFRCTEESSVCDCEPKALHDALYSSFLTVCSPSGVGFAS